MHARIQRLEKESEELFSKRGNLLSLWQEQAEQFYPERADFTAVRNLGRDFAAHLTTSYPILARRSLQDSFSTMLRPLGTDWFEITTGRPDKLTNSDRQWLEWATGLQRRAMYDKDAMFEKASKEGDGDFTTFGQCVKSIELNIKKNALLYRCWHLRDVAWVETFDGQKLPVYRKWEPYATELNAVFKGNVSPEVKTILNDEPYRRIKVKHCIHSSEDYEAPAGKQWKLPYISIFYECETGHILEEVETYNPYYVIPRWQTVSGSQYAYSPATIAALPDARLIQAMTLTLLEAGEKAVNPPLVATQEAVRGDMQIYAGGVTWVDAEYDEKLGEALRPLTIDTRGIPMGFEMRNDIREMISQAFYLNKINMPPAQGKEMTAYEVGQRIEEYIRNALPLFGPVEKEDNAAVCDQTFEILLRNGAFGDPRDIPKNLRGADIEFSFESPLHRAIERKKAQTFQEGKALLAIAADLDPSAPYMMDARTALRDTLDGIGFPAKWTRDEQAMEEHDISMAQKQQAQQMVSMMQQGGEAAKAIGEGGTALNEMVMTG
jgi:hypothetical protein